MIKYKASLPITPASIWATKNIVLGGAKEVPQKLCGIDNLTSGGFIKIIEPASHLYYIQDLIISSGSDILVKMEGRKPVAAIWEKRWAPGSHRTIPLDKNLITRGSFMGEPETVDITLNEKSLVIEGPVINLVKTHGHHFAHQVMELLPGLAWCFKNSIQGDLLVQSDCDETILEILVQLNAWEGKGRGIIRLPLGSQALVRAANILPYGMIVSNHCLSFTPVDAFPLSWAIEMNTWLRALLRQINSQEIALSTECHEKVFLSNSGLRSVDNKERVVEEYISRGYTIINDTQYVSGRRLTLPDKYSLFSQTRVLSGFSGSAFNNALFMQEELRGLILGVASRSTEHLITGGFHTNLGVLKFLPCTELSSDLHSGFRVPLKRLCAALEEFSLLAS